jgi:hypothetical protein
VSNMAVSPARFVPCSMLSMIRALHLNSQFC